MRISINSRTPTTKYIFQAALITGTLTPENPDVKKQVRRAEETEEGTVRVELPSCKNALLTAPTQPAPVSAASLHPPVS